MKQFRALLYIVVLLLISNFAQAGHALGAEITYKCLDAVGNYKVTLVYYRDCSGIPACSGNCSALGSCTKSIDIRGTDPNCNGTLFTSFLLNAVSVRDVNPNLNCPNAKSNCSNMGCVIPGTLTPGIERYEFEGIIDLRTAGIPGTCCNISFSFTECCRSSANQNIASGSFYTQAILDRCTASYPNCNSPVSYTDPLMVMCANQPIKFSFGAFDADLDSLTYELTSSLDNYGVSNTYIAPYSYATPLPYLAPLSGNFPYGFHLDPITGELAFTPQSAGWVGVMAIKIKQWRSVYGVYKCVGQTRRDLQIYIKACDSNAAPIFATIPIGIPSSKPKLVYTTCPGQLICFDIIAKDSINLTDTTYLSIDSNLIKLGLTFTPNYVDSTRKLNGPREDSYKVCWKPNDSLKVGGDYHFMAVAKDSKCPYPGINTQEFTITIPLMQPSILGSTKVLKGGNSTYSTQLHQGSTYTWTFSGDTFHSVTKNTATVFWGNSDTGTVTVQETSPCGSLSSTIGVKLYSNQGLTEISNPLHLIIYPQPATNKLKLNGDISNLVSGQLLALDGKKLQTFGKYELQKGELMLNDFPMGVYVLSISDNQNRTSTQKISLVK